MWRESEFKVLLANHPRDGPKYSHRSSEKVLWGRISGGVHLRRWPGREAIRWFLYIAGRHESVERAVSGRMDPGGRWRLNTCRLCSKILIPSLVAFRLYLWCLDANEEGRCPSNVTLRKIWIFFWGGEVGEK